MWEGRILFQLRSLGANVVGGPRGSDTTRMGDIIAAVGNRGWRYVLNSTRGRASGWHGWSLGAGHFYL